MNRALTGQVGDRQLLKEQKLRNRAEKEDLQVVLGSPHGRRVLNRILAFLQPGTPMWAPNAECQKNAALYDAGNHIRRLIDAADPSALLTMQVEAQRDRPKQDDEEKEVEEEEL